MNKCVHVDFSLYMGRRIIFLFIFCITHEGKKNLRPGRINEKNEMTERIKSEVAWLSKYKYLAVFLKEIKVFFNLSVFVSFTWDSGQYYSLFSTVEHSFCLLIFVYI